MCVLHFGDTITHVRTHRRQNEFGFHSSFLREGEHTTHVCATTTHTRPRSVRNRKVYLSSLCVCVCVCVCHPLTQTFLCLLFDFNQANQTLLKMMSLPSSSPCCCWMLFFFFFFLFLFPTSTVADDKFFKDLFTVEGMNRYTLVILGAIIIGVLLLLAIFFKILSMLIPNSLSLKLYVIEGQSPLFLSARLSIHPLSPPSTFCILCVPTDYANWWFTRKKVFGTETSLAVYYVCFHSVVVCIPSAPLVFVSIGIACNFFGPGLLCSICRAYSSSKRRRWGCSIW